MNTNNIQFNISIRIVTPTIVRGGEEISNVNDCIIDAQNKRLLIIDKEKLLKAIEKQSTNTLEIINKLSKIVMSENETIEKFVKDLRINLNEITKHSIVIKSNIDASKRRNISLPIMSREKTFIPGSTIKGMLRTALLFDYFENKKDEIKKLINQESSPGSSPYIGQDVLRSEASKIDTDIMKYVIVRDTNLIPFSALGLYKIERLPQKSSNLSKNQGLYQYVIAITPDDRDNKKFNFKIILNKYFTKSLLPYWQSIFENKDDRLWNIIKNYSKKLVKKELEILEKLKNNNPGEGINVISSIYNFYNGISKALENKSKNSIYIPLGFGKSYYFNSLGYFIPNHLLKSLKIIKGNVKPDLFPSTRWVIKVNNDYYPLGWCELIMEGK